MKPYNSILLFTAVFIFSSQPAYVAEVPFEEGKRFYSGTNKALSALRMNVLGIEHLVKNDGVMIDGDQRYELTWEQVATLGEEIAEKLGEGLPQLASPNQADWTRLQKAISHFRTRKEVKLPQDKAAILTEYKMLLSEIVETEHLFYTRFATPTPSDPQLGINWMAEALNFWHGICLFMRDGSQLAKFETMNTTVSTLTQELAKTNLTEDQKGDLMVALFSPWQLKTFKDKLNGNWAWARRHKEAYLPKPLPQAALFYSAAQFDETRADILTKTSPETERDQIYRLLQSSCDNTLKAAQVLETQDAPSTDIFANSLRQLQTLTQGISRYLAVELLHLAHTFLKNYDDGKIIDSPKIVLLRQRLAAKALALSADMQFSRTIGDESKTYQVYTFHRISLMHGPIHRYIFMQVANKIYQEATYSGFEQNLASYACAGNADGLLLSLGRDKKAVSERASKDRGAAYKAAFGEAVSLFQTSTAAPTRLVDLAKADAMAILASHIAKDHKAEESKPNEPSKGKAEQSDETIDLAALTALRASLNRELDVLLDDSIRTQTQKFDELLATNQEKDIPSLQARLLRAQTFRSEFLKKIRAADEAFYAIKTGYNHSKLTWEFKPNPKIQTAFTLCTTQNDAIQKEDSRILLITKRKTQEVERNRAAAEEKARQELQCKTEEEERNRAAAEEKAVQELRRKTEEEARNRAAAEEKARQELQSKTIQASYKSILEDIRTRANAVKNEAKTDSQKFEKYSLVLTTARKFLQLLTSSDYRQASDVQKIRADLEEIISKLDVAIKKYTVVNQSQKSTVAP